MEEKSEQLVYLTLGEGWSGVIQSQVADVLSLIAKENSSPSLVTYLSMRGFVRNRRLWRVNYKDTLVRPMCPGVKNWERNRYSVARILKSLRPSGVICRGPIATTLALRAREVSNVNVKICYDGRSARSAELDEYSPGHPLRAEMVEIERIAILQADHRIAVSNKLVEYWRENFNYNREKQTVIPCSLSNSFENVDLSERAAMRMELGWDETTCGLVYSGSIAGWQISTLLRDCMRSWLQRPHVQLLFLSKQGEFVDELKREFPGRVACRWEQHEDVPRWLSSADYGLLLREKNITNRVAAPVKFAEYLACGLKVICSEDLGDYSEFVNAHSAGNVVSEVNINSILLGLVDEKEKSRMQSLAAFWFSKKSPRIRNLYRCVTKALIPMTE